MSEIRFPKYYRPFFEPKRYKGLKGGRGSAKSHCFAGHVILRAASETGFRAVCVREVQRSIADSVKQLLEDKIAAFGLSGFFRSTETEITGRNGSKIIFRGMQNHTAASIKSLEGYDLAWVEEAQTISAKSLELLTPTIRKPGSELWFSWNPDAETDPVDAFFIANDGHEDFLLSHVNYDQNPWFPDELRADMERDKRRDPDKYAHVWGGEYRGMSEARVFRNWRVSELTPPENIVWFYGADWGFAQDATAALRCCIMGPTLYIDHEVYEVGVPTEALPKFLMGVPGANKWPMRGDNARPETIDYLRRHGFQKLRSAKKGKGSVEDGVSFLQGMDILIHPRCVNTIREFQSYAYKTDPRTGEIVPAIEDANNHLIDALRYAVEGLHRRGKIITAIQGEAEDKLDRPTDYGSWGGEESWKVA